jgi:hypothetical protein
VHGPNLVLSEPQFAQPLPSPDPKKFQTVHGSDTPLFNLLNKKLRRPIPAPRQSNLTMTLLDAYGPTAGAKVLQGIKDAGQLVFHSLGDTGSTQGPSTQSLVADKMVQDFADQDKGGRPSFCYHLGDVVYSFGEAKFYFDQFYEPYRSYPAPIFAIAGNHDGMVFDGDKEPSLNAFLRNFVNDAPTKTPESGNLLRTAMTQPGVFFALDVPLATIIGLYSNVLEDPGVISSEGDSSSPVSDIQLPFLVDALKQAKKKGGAVIIATHHPPFSGGGNHSSSQTMLGDIDKACKEADCWPHVHLSGHAHNYQRFSRTLKNPAIDIPYIVSGSGGHRVLAIIGPGGGPLRTPLTIGEGLILKNIDDQDFGYLRIVVNKDIIRAEFHDATPGQDTKSGIDAVTVDLKTHNIIAN